MPYPFSAPTPLGVFNVCNYGAVGDGITDDSVAILAAISACANAQGGTVFFPPPGHYLCNSQIAIPNDGATIPNNTPYLRLTGAGHYYNGQWTGGTHGASLLDLRYAGTNAKLLSLGTGVLEIDHLTLLSGGTDNLPFAIITNTTLQAHDLCISGNTAHSGLTCQQDVFILGGTGTTSGGLVTNQFQGYGTVIERCYFDHIRRGVLGQTSCNGIVIQNNTVALTCGSNLTIGAWIELNNASVSAKNVGNVIAFNTIELGGYPYAIACTANCVENFILFNSYYDQSGSSVAGVYFDSTSAHNLIFDGYHTSAITGMSDQNGGNVMLASHPAGGLQISGSLSLPGVPTSDPHVIGQLWSNGGIVTISAG